MSETPNTITAIKKELLMRLGHDADIFALISLCTREPYVVCDEETFDDEVFLFLDEEEAKKEALKMIKVVNMEEHIKKYPHELSGGQQQRVAIARTLALKPDIILFDEPMSALDADNRLGLRKELKDIQKKFKTTMIYITHDQEEAFSLSDRVMVMNNGKIEQIDEPNKIFNHPKNDYVRKFVTNHLIEKVSSIEKCTGIDL